MAKNSRARYYNILVVYYVLCDFPMSAVMQIEGVLSKYGPAASEELVKRLVGSGVCSADAARKRISRAVDRGPIKSTNPVKFKNGYLYYLDEHCKGRLQKKIKSLLGERPPLQRVYKCLLANKGFITIGQIAKASGAAPNNDRIRIGRRLFVDAVVEQLQCLGVIKSLEGYKDLYKVGEYFGSPEISSVYFEKTICLEQALFEDLISWIQNVYLVGTGSYSARETGKGYVEFNSCCWDFKAPVYLGPAASPNEICPKNKTIRGFMVVDVVGFREYSTCDAEAYIERLKTVNLNWKGIRLFPVVLGMGYNSEALKALRSRGIAPLTHREVWGRNIQELIRLYKTILRKTTEPDDSKDHSADIEAALKLASSTSGTDGVLGNIKGDLFEMLVAFAYKTKGYHIVLQKKITDKSEDREYEIDVVALADEKECLLIECKGRQLSPDEHKAEIEKHFNDRCRTAALPFGWDVVKRYKEVSAIYVTTDTEQDISGDLLQNRKSHGITCSVMPRKELLQFFESLDTRLPELIKKYY